MGTEGIGGNRVYASYASEGLGSLGTAGSPFDTPFGRDVRINVDSKRNLEPIYDLYNRNMQTMVAKNFEGMATIDCQLSNPWFFYSLLGSHVGTVFTGSPVAWYTHTYVESNRLPTITIANGYDLSTNLHRSLRGGIINSATLTATKNQIVRLRLEIPYANETPSSTLQGNSVTETYQPVSFAGATLNIAGSTISTIPSHELVFTNNAVLETGNGSQVPTKSTPGKREYRLRGTFLLEDATEFMNRFYGASDGLEVNPDPEAYVTLNYNTTGSGTAQNNIQVNLGSVWFDQHTINPTVDETVKEDVVMRAAYCGSVTCINGGSPMLGI